MRDGLVRLGLALMPEPGFAKAALPLFDEGRVGCAEWSFDIGWGNAGIPEWLDALLDDYSREGWLLGHGVSYSLLGASGNHERWLAKLAREVAQRRYRWITEHIGFVGAGRFTFAAPLPMPAETSVIDLGADRLGQMAAMAGVPVGVENLATCLSAQDATRQGALIEGILKPVDGILVLDLHNLWCQSLNCDVDVHSLVAALPLQRVREIHVAGGRVSVGPTGRTLRRDTHDALVEAPLLALLERVAPRCPNLEAVIYERLGPSLADPDTHDAYRSDVRMVGEVVANLASSDSRVALPDGGARNAPTATLGTVTSEAAEIARYQAALLDLLAAGASAAEIQSALQQDAPAFATATLDDDLVAVATDLTRTWGVLA